MNSKEGLNPNDRAEKLLGICDEISGLLSSPPDEVSVWAQELRERIRKNVLEPDREKLLTISAELSVLGVKFSSIAEKLKQLAG